MQSYKATILKFFYKCKIISTAQSMGGCKKIWLYIQGQITQRVEKSCKFKFICKPESPVSLVLNY